MRQLTAVFAALLVSTLALQAQPAFLRDPHRDVEKKLGAKLDKDQAELVDYTMLYYAVKFGRAKEKDKAEDKSQADDKAREKLLLKAIRDMSKEEYAKAVEKAALVAGSKTARGFIKLGKFGETLLKALIVVAEDAVKDLDLYIKEKAIQFDTRH